MTNPKSDPSLTIKRIKFFWGDDPTIHELPPNFPIARRSKRQLVQQNASDILITKLMQVANDDSSLPLKILEM